MMPDISQNVNNFFFGQNEFISCPKTICGHITEDISTSYFYSSMCHVFLGDAQS